MFIDSIKIHLKAGNGGNGAVSFRREKYVAAGGPDGGDGGNGGDVIFRVDPGANTLLAFRYKRKFAAMPGENGKGEKFHGKSGESLIIPLPAGTLIREPDTGRIIHDMSEGGDFVICRGGRGGWGNRHFATPTRQIPRFAKSGTAGEEREVLLELKMIADVGLIGFPNVGKSSILSRLSAARPKIANYPFTTLSPNLGVVSEGGEGHGFVLADIPGLIEGAADGAGLGHAFLRHVDRCRLLLHVVDISGSEGRDPCEDLKKIDSELKRYSEVLASRPQIVVANKCDAITGQEENVARFREYVASLGREICFVSAVSGEGLPGLVKAVSARLAELPGTAVYAPEVSEEERTTRGAGERVTTVRQENRTFFVEGEWLRNLLGQVNFDDRESVAFFQRILAKEGVIDLLRQKGIEEGDFVNIYDFEFEFVN